MLVGTVVSTAQNGTNSPYTRFGYGDLSNHSFGAGRSMGGIGIGLRSSRQINPMNPASYSGMDSLTFLFDFGASFQFSAYKDGTNKQKDFNGNVEYMAMQFPLFKQVAMSAGLIPFSHVGYRFGEQKTSADGQIHFDSFEGTGGLNQLFAGLSIELWKKRLSVGSNINYLFGTISHASITGFGSSNSTSVVSMSSTNFTDVTFDFGLQYVQPLSKTDHFVFGLIHTPKKRLKNELYKSVSNGSEYLSQDTITDTPYEVSDRYGVGVSYQTTTAKGKKLIVAADYSLQEWDKVANPSKDFAFNNRSKFAAGFELVPNLFSRPYINRMRYRAGLNYSNSYIKVNGNGFKEYGATVGVGFPINLISGNFEERSFINLSFEYVKKFPELKTMIIENYFRLTLSYTFNEYWFFKRKVD